MSMPTTEQRCERWIGNDVIVHMNAGQDTFSCSLVHDPSSRALVACFGTTGETEVLSIDLSAYGLYPQSPEHVFVKDWSEGEGLAQSLVDAGVAEFVDEYTVGPYRSRAVELALIPQG